MGQPCARSLKLWALLKNFFLKQTSDCLTKTGDAVLKYGLNPGLFFTVSFVMELEVKKIKLAIRGHDEKLRYLY